MAEVLSQMPELTQFGMKFPDQWFDEPSNDISVPLTVDPDTGQVYGLAALNDTCHAGYAQNGQCVRMPRQSDYADFNNGSGGHVWGLSGKQIPVGAVTALGTHERSGQTITTPAQMTKAMEDVSQQVMAVRAYAVDKGLALAGAAWPNTDPILLARCCVGRPSGDWRNSLFLQMDGMRLLGVHIVSDPGYPVPLAASASLFNFDGGPMPIMKLQSSCSTCSGNADQAEKKTCCGNCAEGKPCSGHSDVPHETSAGEQVASSFVVSEFKDGAVTIVSEDGRKFVGNVAEDVPRTPLSATGLLKILDSEKKMSK